MLRAFRMGVGHPYLYDTVWVDCLATRLVVPWIGVRSFGWAICRT